MFLYLICRYRELKISWPEPELRDGKEFIVFTHYHHFFHHKSGFPSRGRVDGARWRVGDQPNYPPKLHENEEIWSQIKWERKWGLPLCRICQNPSLVMCLYCKLWLVNFFPRTSLLGNTGSIIIYETDSGKCVTYVLITIKIWNPPVKSLFAFSRRFLVKKLLNHQAVSEALVQMAAKQPQAAAMLGQSLGPGALSKLPVGK